MIDFITTTALQNQSCDCICIGFYSDKLQENFSANSELTTLLRDGNIEEIISQGDFTGKLGLTHLVSMGKNNACTPRILLVGLGESEKCSKKNYHKAIESIISAIKPLPIKHLGVHLFAACKEELSITYMLQQLAFQLQRQTYQYSKQALQQGIALYTKDNCSKDTDKHTPLEKVSCIVNQTINDEQQGNDALFLGASLGMGVNTTRFLGDLPANVCTPTYLANFAEQMGQQYDCLTIRVKDEADMQQLGMNVLLSVSQGSKQEAKFIEIEYTPGQAKSNDTIVLVGKGVTFDTGGISLKPSASMDEMKYDMCGAASVFGTMHFLAESMSCQTRVVAVIPAVENMPSDRATKPGDIFLSYSGKTVEVLNTDAEGRLILADALSYAEETYQPTKMINVATLTGACIIALGNHRSAVMSNDDAFAKELMEVGQSVCDPCWQLPLDDEYDKLLHSNFADMANIGGRAAGSITAGCFLKRFVKNTTWAHLDIAGVAWLEGKKKGATGRPVPLLANWIIQQ